MFKKLSLSLIISTMFSASAISANASLSTDSLMAGEREVSIRTDIPNVIPSHLSVIKENAILMKTGSENAATVITFFNLDCPPCKENWQELEKIYSQELDVNHYLYPMMTLSSTATLATFGLTKLPVSSARAVYLNKIYEAIDSVTNKLPEEKVLEIMSSFGIDAVHNPSFQIELEKWSIQEKTASTTLFQQGVKGIPFSVLITQENELENLQFFFSKEDVSSLLEAVQK